MKVAITTENVVLDLDDTLFSFSGEENALERFRVEKNFFTNLQPLEQNIKVVNEWLDRKPENIYIMSASPNQQADNDKIKCLCKHLPKLRAKNILMCRIGEDKSKYLESVGNYTLIDDYSKNLINVVDANGNAIKFVNHYDNHIGKHTQYNIPFIYSFEELIF